MTKRLIIGLIGKMRSGKTTAGLWLEPMGFHRVHPAEPMRAMIKVILRGFGYDDHTINRMLEGDLKREPIKEIPGQNPTSLQQSIGTEWGRDCVDPLLWTNLVERRFRNTEKAYNDSIRFPNEASLILSLGGYLIKLERPNNESEASIAAHVSEQWVDKLPYHFLLENSSNVSEMHRKLSRMHVSMLTTPSSEMKLNWPDVSLKREMGF